MAAKRSNTKSAPRTQVGESRNHRSMLLCGAGASIPAGLPDTFELTEKVYGRLRQRSKNEAGLFGYVISRLVTREVLAGGSPFGKVNIEAAYDAIIRLLSYSTDPTSDFVSGLDPNLNRYVGRIDEQEFANAFGSSVAHVLAALQQNRGSWAPSFFASDFSGLRSILERSSAGSPQKNTSNHILPFLRALISCLNHDTIDAAYISPLVGACSEQNVAIVSLNYDMVVESACSMQNVEYDYGLQSWNNKDLVSFSRNKLSLIKLHGSINWLGEPDEIKIAKPEEIGTVCNMIFGTGEGKLKPDGPFLQLRYEFERRLANCEKLFVVGYSYGDNHLNGILRRWSKTRTEKRPGCLININPSGASLYEVGIRPLPYPTRKNTEPKKLFELKYWTKKAEEVIDQIVTFLPPSVSHEQIPEKL